MIPFNKYHKNWKMILFKNFQVGHLIKFINLFKFTIKQLFINKNIIKDNAILLGLNNYRIKIILIPIRHL